ILEEDPVALFEIQTGRLPAATRPHKDATERQHANASTWLWMSVRHLVPPNLRSIALRSAPRPGSRSFTTTTPDPHESTHRGTPPGRERQDDYVACPRSRPGRAGAIGRPGGRRSPGNRDNDLRDEAGRGTMGGRTDRFVRERTRDARR